MRYYEPAMFSKRVYTKEISSVSELFNGMLTTKPATHPELSKL